ncbi:citrate lyase acyl carrier protein [Xanthobacteraceae bacterium Astr-EGSB]|uniref:citrate lyase acyl carrier protein n=1 Tax=Astrobacterium formosum TaxID=3069710 RepID=UPI0027B87350|nr:citrate lyase acyl carrier protein [Xanthobacteraceae bacterium Astr-EGSB]
MKIIKDAMAGTLESSDVLVKVSPSDGPLEVVVKSEVERQFGEQIRRVVADTLARLTINEGVVIVEDKGALDCTIRARLQAAVLRGGAVEGLDWSILQ